MPIAKTVWGLDIASSAIKGVRMQAQGETIQLLEADILPLERDTKGGESSGRDRRIWQALQRFQAKHNLSAERVAVGLPGSMFFIRPFDLFLVGDKPEFELVQYEMEQHIPFGLDAVLWDYEIFAPADPASREREGMLFAMKKEALNNYLLSLSAARIDPAQVQAAPLALYNFVRHELNVEEPTLVADIGAGGTDVVAVAGRSYWVRTVGQGGEAMTAAIGNAFRPRELNYEEAESIKTNLAQLPSRGEAIERITPALRAYVGEMRNTVRHFAQQYKISFTRLILLGGASRTYGLQPLLAEELGMRVSTPAGLGHIETVDKARAAYVNKNLPLFATAIGLGLQGLGRSASRVNMVSATLAQRRVETQARRAGAIALAAAAILFLVLGAFWSWRARVYRNAVEGGNQDSLKTALTPVLLRWHKFSSLNEIGAADAEISEIASEAQGRGVWLAVLDKLARMLPDNRNPATPDKEKVWLLRLSLEPKLGGAGVYEGTIEAGVLVRPDSTQGDWVSSVLVVPMRADAQFRNVSDLQKTFRSATLSYGGNPNPPRYFICTVQFEVAASKGGGA